MFGLLANTVGTRFLFESNKNLFIEGESVLSHTKRFESSNKKATFIKVAGKNKHKGITLHERHITSVLPYDIVKFLGKGNRSFISTVSVKCSKLGYDFDNQSHQRLM